MRLIYIITCKYSNFHSIGYSKHYHLLTYNPKVDDLHLLAMTPIFPVAVEHNIAVTGEELSELGGRHCDWPHLLNPPDLRKRGPGSVDCGECGL